MLTTAARPGALSLFSVSSVRLTELSPAPVDKDPDQEPRDKGARGVYREGGEPGDLRDERPFGGRTPIHPRQGHDGEQDERPDLGDDHNVLDAGRDLGADNAQGRHRDDDDDGEQRNRQLRAGEAVETQEHVGVAGRHVGQGPHDQDTRDADGPAPDPSQIRSHRPRHPRERRAAVLVGAVHVVERGCDEEHRDERGQQDSRRLHADGHDDQPDDRRQRVGRCRRGYTDDQGIPEADGILF